MKKKTSGVLLRYTLLRRIGVVVLLLLIATMSLVSCGEGEAQIIRETVIVTSEPVVVTSEPQERVVVVTATPDPDATPEPAPEQELSFTTPHPILSDVNVRRAIAYCTDRDQLIESVYPFLEEEQRQQMFMDTFIPRGHWAEATENITRYPFDPEQGRALLEESGWQETGEGQARENANGEPLAIEFLTTDAQFRVTWATVFEQQLMQNCGIEIIRKHAPGSWVFGNASGLQRRQFELGAFAWVGQVDPSGSTLYACNQIPRPENNWEGQNYMGWCNERASNAIIAANNTINREERIRQYAIVQEEFTKDMVSLPLFNRFEAAAASNTLLNFQADPSEQSYVVDIESWEMADGSDTVVLGVTQQPASLFTLLEDSSVAQMLYDLLTVRIATGKGYNYQPVAVEQLPTLENGGATMQVVELSEGDMVWSTAGEAMPLAPGVEFINADNETVTYEEGIVSANQLSVTFKLDEGITWEDGEPLTRDDLMLAHKINCDPESGAVSLMVCNSIESYDVPDDTTIAITYLPAAQWPEYFVYTAGTYAGTTFTIGAYPAHRVLSDGRTLAEVPASEWSTLPEIAQKPLSCGPYRIVDWQEGQRMIFEANPYYYKGEPPIKNVVVEIFSDTKAAVAQLLSGNVDVLGTETLGAGPELETVMNAGTRGEIQFFPLASATWEHVDMNLYLR
jgi:ABC-type transport system substrate-binding protein